MKEFYVLASKRCSCEIMVFSTVKLNNPYTITYLKVAVKGRQLWLGQPVNYSLTFDPTMHLNRVKTQNNTKL